MLASHRKCIMLSKISSVSQTSASRRGLQEALISITAINNFFSTYWTALKYAVAQASLTITPLINRLDPIDPTGWTWLNMLTMLGFGLAFLGVPAIGVAILSLTSTARFAASALAISFMQAPAATRAMWPHGTDNSRIIQSADLDQALSDASSTLSDMISNTNSLLMNDMTTFIKFVEGGQYSGPDMLSLPAKTVGLDFALKTYMTSTAMGRNSWLALPHLGNYYNSFEDYCVSANGGIPDGDYICGDSSGGASYWSPDTGRAYNLVYQRQKPGDANQQRELLHEIVDKEWAPLNILFDGSYNCTAAGKSGSGDINFNWDGTLDISCISQLPMKIGCRDYCELVNGTCPFLQDQNCNGQPFNDPNYY